jgi:glycosyltransferase involved in cell wall biosynthesis
LKISIVIPAFNEERLLGDTLSHAQAGLTEFSKHGWEGELIVCDNNSTDRTAEIARQAGARVVFEPVNQIARARNCGAAAASGDWLIFIDADSRPSVELFKAVMHQMESGQCLAGGSTVELDGEDHFWADRGIALWNWISRSFNWMAGSFIFCQTQAFRTIGGFSSELFASEELDLSKRLKVHAAETGKRIVIIDEYPLITSARKIHLYSSREHIWFLAKTIATWGGTLNRRDSCPTWYDGRR